MASNASVEPPRASVAGIVDPDMTNNDPNRIVIDAPVVLVWLASKYKNNDARPSAAPRTMPVARSLPLGRRRPISSIAPDAAIEAITNPASGPYPT